MNRTVEPGFVIDEGAPAFVTARPARRLLGG